MGKYKSIGALFVVLLVSSPASAAMHVFNFSMDGSQEVPAVVTAATGTCAVTLDDVAETVTVSCTYSDLTSNANNAHIHAGAVGVIGAPIVTLSFDAATSGTATVTDASMSTANVNAMIAGDTYINVHSVNNSGGEIRGQVANLPVPAMSTWGLLCTTALVLTAGTLVLRRRTYRTA